MLSPEQLGAVQRVVSATQAEDHPYCKHTWNVHRWITAYGGDEQETTKVLQRHLRVRHIMNLDDLPDTPEQSLTDKHAPITIIGRNHPEDNKVLLFDLCGQMDIYGLVENIRISPFMRSKFRWMERVHREVVAEEQRTGKQSGGLLVIDLKGLKFNPSLLSILAGPYRIMWGTLFEQYPQMIQQILIINAPTFVNVLYSTCIPFIPDNYRDKIVISSSNTRETLLKHIHESCLPVEYGGTAPIRQDDGFELCSRPLLIPEAPFPKCEPIDVQMDSVVVPAGGQTFHKFHFEKGDEMDIYMHNEQEFTLFYFHSSLDTKNESEWKEIIAGCEKPALAQVDHLRWIVPHDGYYYVRYGNEKAWFLSVTIKYSFQHTNKGRMHPLEQWSA